MECFLLDGAQSLGRSEIVFRLSVNLFLWSIELSQGYFLQHSMILELFLKK